MSIPDPERWRAIREAFERAADAPQPEALLRTLAGTLGEDAAVVRALLEDPALGLGLEPLVELDPRVIEGAIEGAGDSVRMASPLGPADTLDRYTILDEGAGGVASVVHRAHDPALGCTVAIKLLRPGASTRDRLQFERQRLILEAMDHPSIPGVLDHGAVPAGPARGMAYVVLPWVDGRHFDQWAMGRSWRPVVRVMAGVLDVVHAANTACVVHRDLKPSNILVDGAAPAPRVHVLDFGIARLTGGPLADIAPQTRGTLGPSGTPAYMAPERFAGNGEPAPTEDVYAAACVLYECLTGAPPHVEDAGRSVVELARRRGRAAPAMPAGMDRQLATILRAALDPAPERRYGGAAQLAADLRRAADGMPILRRPPGAWLRVRLWARREPALAGVSGALAIVVSVAIALGTWQAALVARERNAAEANFELMRGYAEYTLREHDRLLSAQPRLIDARRALAEQAAETLAAMEGPRTREQALLQAELWLGVAEIELSIHGRSLWRAENAYRFAQRALALLEPWRDLPDPIVQTLRARAWQHALWREWPQAGDRLATARAALPVMRRADELAPGQVPTIVALAHARLHLGLGASSEGEHATAIAELRAAAAMAERAVQIDQRDRAALGTRAFVAYHLGGLLRGGDAAERSEALTVLARSIRYYDQLAGDPYLDARGATARAVLASHLLGMGHIGAGWALYARAIADADAALAVDPTQDQAMRQVSAIRNWAAHDALRGIERTDGLRIENPWRRVLATAAVCWADESLAVHRARLARSYVPHDERERYFGYAVELCLRTRATRALVDLEPR